MSEPIRRIAGPIKARLLRYLEEMTEFVEPPEMVSEEEKYEDLRAQARYWVRAIPGLCRWRNCISSGWI